MKYYKVVKVVGGRFLSIVMSEYAEKEYFVGQFVEPKDYFLKLGYGLLVFKDFETAHGFAEIEAAYLAHNRKADKVCIFEAEVEGVMDLVQYHIHADSITCEEDFSEEYLKDDMWPKHSVMVKKVMLKELTEEIEYP